MRPAAFRIDLRLRILGNRVSAGVDIVTLDPEDHFNKQAINNNPLHLVIAIVIMTRAGEESERKSQRVRKAWKAKKEAARNGIVSTAMVPAWLVKDGNGIIVDKNASHIVKRIFCECIDGNRASNPPT